MRYQWLLFDADGTLFDYNKAEKNALHDTFKEIGITFYTPYIETYQRINRQIWMDFENNLISSTALRIRRFELLFDTIGVITNTDLFSACYLKHLAQGSDLISGAEEVICALHGKFRLGIITNGLKDVQHPRLESSRIAGMFDVVGVSEEIGAAKPDPAFYEAIFTMMGHPTRETVLVIGDSLTSDIKGGNIFGLDTCWFNPDRKLPDPHIPANYEIFSLDDLLAIVNP